MPVAGERPHRRPVQRRSRVEARGDDIVGVPAGVDFFRVIELPVAEKLDVVRVDRFRFGCLRILRIAFSLPDLVAVKRARIPLDGLAERARLRLPGGLPLPALLLRKLFRSELRLLILSARLLPAQWTWSQGSVSSVVRSNQVTTPLTGLIR